MQKYSQSTPDWLYQTPALDHNVLPTIQKELVKVMIHSKKHMEIPYSSTFFCYGQSDEDRQIIWETCPTLKQELSRLKLLDTFYFIGFVSVDASKEFPPHIDTLDVGLNIPLYNCNNTYTVWYDAKVLDQPMPDYVLGSALTGAARIVDKKNAVEIGRIEANLPLWINGNVAHRPETHHDKLRMAASIRFYPEPVDENGNLWPHLIK